MMVVVKYQGMSVFQKPHVSEPEHCGPLKITLPKNQSELNLFKYFY
jgi:hypothetical protein